MNKTKVPFWFWIGAILLMIWNLMGILNFFQHITITEEALQAMPDNERELFANFPWWTQIAFALAVFGGWFGSIALMMKRKIAGILFIVSLIGIIVQMGHSISLSLKMDTGGEWVIIMTVLLILTGVFAIWMTRYSVKKGWLR